MRFWGGKNGILTWFEAKLNQKNVQKSPQISENRPKSTKKRPFVFEQVIFYQHLGFIDSWTVTGSTQTDFFSSKNVFFYLKCQIAPKNP